MTVEVGGDDQVTGIKVPGAVAAGKYWVIECNERVEALESFQLQVLLQQQTILVKIFDGL